METTKTVESAERNTWETITPGIHHAFVVSGDEDRLSDYLAFSIYRSLNAATMYENAARMVHGKEVKSFLKDMADLKRYESDRITRYHQNSHRMSGDDMRPLPIDPMAMYCIDVDCNPIGSMDDACRFALKKELNNMQLYMRLSDLEMDPSIKKFFTFLVQLQKAHVQFVQNQLALVDFERMRKDISVFISDTLG